MAARKQPTNAELMQEIKSLQANLLEHNKRILMLETAKIQTDAVAEYLVRHPAQTVTESKLNKDLIKYIGYALAIIATLVGAAGVRP